MLNFLPLEEWTFLRRDILCVFLCYRKFFLQMRRKQQKNLTINTIIFLLMTFLSEIVRQITVFIILIQDKKTKNPNYLDEKNRNRIPDQGWSSMK